MTKRDEGSKELRVMTEAHEALLRSVVAELAHSLQSGQFEDRRIAFVKKGVALSIIHILNANEKSGDRVYRASLQLYIAGTLKPRPTREQVDQIVGEVAEFFSLKTVNSAAKQLRVSKRPVARYRDASK